MGRNLRKIVDIFAESLENIEISACKSVLFKQRLHINETQLFPQTNNMERKCSKLQHNDDLFLTVVQLCKNELTKETV